MLTTCPECRTTFRIVHAQLEARRGMVRCGYCRAVFNAYDMLLPELETLAGEHAEAQATGRDGQEAGPVGEANPAAEAPPPIDAGPDDGPPPAADEDAYVLELSSQPAEPAARSEPPEMPPGPPAADSPDALLLSELPTRSARRARRRGPRAFLWGALNLLLAVLLLAQLAYFLREPIVSWLPELRPAFTAACAVVGCEIPQARRLEVFRVEASSLETDPEQLSRATLRVSFSNRSGDIQTWPHFLLKLTDARSEPLAQRIFAPRDFLSAEQRITPGMAPMSEVEFRIVLDLGGLTAAGYEVKPHYP